MSTKRTVKKIYERLLTTQNSYCERFITKPICAVEVLLPKSLTGRTMLIRIFSRRHSKFGLKAF
jgi:hypothetical protein